MKESSQKLLNEIAVLSADLLAIQRETMEYWAPETPPVTVAYGEIGHQIAKIYQDMSPDILHTIMDLIETGMNSAEEEIGIAIATGLIEALAGEAYRDGNWDIVRAKLGPESRRYADVWMDIQPKKL